MGFNPPGERPTFSKRIATPEPGKDNEKQTALLDPVAAMPADANQAEATPLDKIHVTVQDLSGNRLAYVLKRTIPMGKLIAHYHEATGRRPGHFRLRYDGEMVNEDDTPESLKMEDHGLLEAMTEQFGGANGEQNTSFNPVDPIETNQAEASHAAVDDKTHVVVQDQGGNRLEYTVKRTFPLAKLMKHYHEATGRQPEFLRFHFDGQRAVETDTPESLGMKDYDLLDAMFPADGGTNKEQTTHSNRIAALSDQTEASSTAAERKVHITVNDQSGKQVTFLLRSTLPLAKLMKRYNEMKGHAPGFLRFYHDGQRVTDTDTTDSLEMVDYDILDATEVQYCI